MYIHTYIRIRDAGVIYMHIMYISYRWGSSSAPPASLLPYPAAAYCINKKIQDKTIRKKYATPASFLQCVSAHAQPPHRFRG